MAAKRLEEFYIIVPDDDEIKFNIAFVYYFGIGVTVDKDRAKVVWSALNVLFNDNFQIPIGIKEM